MSFFINHVMFWQLYCLFQDMQIIYYGLQGMEALSPYRDSVLRSIAKTARYERHEANDVLY